MVGRHPAEPLVVTAEGSAAPGAGARAARTVAAGGGRARASLHALLAGHANASASRGPRAQIPLGSPTEPFGRGGSTSRARRSIINLRSTFRTVCTCRSLFVSAHLGVVRPCQRPVAVCSRAASSRFAPDSSRSTPATPSLYRGAAGAVPKPDPAIARAASPRRRGRRSANPPPVSPSIRAAPMPSALPVRCSGADERAPGCFQCVPPRAELVASAAFG